MKCIFCGREISDKSVFCEFCGNRVGEYSQNVYAQPAYQNQVQNANTMQRRGNTAAIVISAVCVTCVLIMGAYVLMLGTKGSSGDIQTDDDVEAVTVTAGLETEPQTALAVPKTQSETTTETQTETQTEETTEKTKKTTEKTTTTKPTTTTKATTTVDPYKIPVYPDSYYSNYATMYVSTQKDNLACRVGPGYDYSKVFDAGIPRGTALTVTSEKYDSKSGETWAYISYNGYSGWCTEKYLSYEKPYYTDIVAPDNSISYGYYFTVVVDDLQFRKGPGTGYDSMGTVEKGRVFEELGWNDNDNGKWVYTCVDGQYGWLMCYRGDSYTADDYKAYLVF